MKIYKFEVPIQDEFVIDLPIGSSILTFQLQNGIPHLWVLLNPDEERIPFYFKIIGTGEECAINNYESEYIGTIQRNGLVWHLFLKS